MRNYISGSFSTRRSRPLALSIMRLREQIGLCNKSSLGTQLGWIKLTSRIPTHPPPPLPSPPFSSSPSLARSRPDIVGINRYKFSRIPSRIRSERDIQTRFSEFAPPSFSSPRSEEAACTRGGARSTRASRAYAFYGGLYEWSILQSEYFAEFESPSHVRDGGQL